MTTTQTTFEILAHEVASVTGADKNEVYLWLVNGDAQNLTADDLQDLILEWNSYQEPAMTETTPATVFTVYDLDSLRQAKAEALHVCQEAWHIAETHTVEEGYPYEQWRAAVEQAEEAQRVYEAIWAMYDAAKTQAINAVEDAPIDVTPMGGW